MSINATEVQMAALLSMSTLSSEYKLWASYANAKRRLGLSSSPSARERWRAAQVAVHDSLHGMKITGSNLVQIIAGSKT